MRRYLLFLALGLAAAAASPAAAQSLGDIARKSSSAQPAGLFGKTEIRSGTLDALPKWSGVVTKMAGIKDMLDACEKDVSACSPDAVRQWHDIMRDGRKLEGLTLLRHVNASFNKWPYKLDRDTYGQEDYWATVPEFMSRSGDCEDFSIAKFYALLQLGWPPEDMRIVALVDRIRGIGHAVLVVRLGDDEVVLDNLSNVVMSHKRYKHYDPQYSINETTRWVHVNGVGK